MKNKKITENIFLVICILAVIISLYFIIDYYLDYKKDESVVKDLKEMIIEDNDEDKTSIKIDAYKDYTPLYEENNDFIGWLTIENTNIDYPVMQTKHDEQFYLKRNFRKEYSAAGTLFCNASADLEKPSCNVIIHGHNMNSGAMFHNLLKYENEDFYKKHKYITFDTIYEYGKYEVIAAYRHNVNFGSYEYYNFIDGTEEEFNKYIDIATRNTPYTMDSSAEYDDRLITLSTCAYHTKNGRYIVIAKQIESKDVTIK